MPAVHFVRRRRSDTPGDQYETKNVIVCGLTASSWGLTTRDKTRVTCKKCRKKLGLDGPAEFMPAHRDEPSAPPTAWDRLDTLDASEPAPEPVDVEVPPPVVAREVRNAPGPIRNIVTHRVAVVFFHLMRSHLGMLVVEEVATLASVGATGSGRDDELMARAERLAELVVNGPPAR